MQNKNYDITENKLYRLIIICSVIITSILPASVAHSADADANKRSKLASKYTKERPLTILSDFDFAPYEYRDDDGVPAGYNVEVLKTILDEMGVVYEFRMLNWEEAYDKFKKRKGDLILNSRIFGMPHTYIGKSVIDKYNIGVAYKKGTTPLVDFDNADFTTVGFKKNSYSAMYLNKDSTNAQPQKFASLRQGLKLLITGKLKYYVYNEQMLQSQLRTIAESSSIQISDMNIPNAEITFIGYDRELINELDARFYELERQGVIEKLHTKWFSPENYKEENPISYWYIPAIIIAVAVLWTIQRALQKRVNKMNEKKDDMNNILWQALHISDNYIISNDLRTGLMSNLHGDFFKKKTVTIDEFAEMCHPDDIDTLLDRRCGLKTGKLYTGQEYRFKRSADDSEWRTYLVSSVLKYDKKSIPCNIVSTMTDITEENKAGQRELEMSNMYEQIFNIPLVGIAIFSPDGYLLQSNDKMKEIFKFSDANDEFYFSTCIFDMEPVSGNIDPGNIEELLVCHKFNIPERDVYDYIDFRLCPIRSSDDNVIYLLVMAQILNEERMLQCESLENRRKMNERNYEAQCYGQDLKALLENIQIKIWQTFSEERVFKIYNGLADVEMTLTFEQLLSTAANDEDRAVMEHMMTPPKNAAVDYKTIVLKLPIDIVTNNIKDTWYSITYIPNVNDKGEIDGSFGIAHNITEDMQRQEDIKNEISRAQEISKRKHEFLANMTHEIRTPLNAILGFSDVLNVVEASEERKEYVRIINHNCKLLMKLINDLLEISNIDSSNKEAIKPVEVDFAEYFTTTCNSLRGLVNTPGIDFIIDNPYTTLPTYIATESITKILTNFVDNAVKYTSEGHIKVGYRTEGKGIYMYCEDTGIGIPKDKQNIVFERFFKLNDFVQGTGIGLSICKVIAERMNGRIGVISDGEGHGSQFWIWIPCDVNGARQ